jgi:membrane protease YdiL (CAAX protease family)
MQKPSLDPVTDAIASSIMLASLAAGAYLISSRRRRQLLEYEPRRPVPWNAAATLLAILAVVNALLTLRTGEATDGVVPQLTAAERARALVAQSLWQMFVVGGFFFIVAAASKAHRSDLGFPTRLKTWRRDIGLGALACLVALAPVHIIQIVLVKLLYGNEIQSSHPLIKSFLEAPPDFLTFLLTLVAAVVVAPISEEIIFRLLLQGWLEKWEDQRLGWRVAAANDEPLANYEARTTSDDEQSLVRKAPGEAELNSSPPRKGVGGLPYGWYPVLASALCFGLAHTGYGPEPVPIFLLGIVLGYLYQRTHRVVPGILTHALFNLFTVFILWRMKFHAG